MPLLSPVIVTLRQPFAPCFPVCTLSRMQRLRTGPLRAPGRRTVFPAQ